MTSFIIQGKHLIPEGRSLILNPSYRINNFRLSTSMKNLPIVSDLEIKSLLTLPPLVQIDDEGRVREVKTGKVIREIYIVEVVHSDGKIEFFHSTVVESAKSLNVPRTRLSNRLDDGKPLSSAGSNYKLRRIRVYFPSGDPVAIIKGIEGAGEV